jgi:hypothetical protein
VLARPLNQTQPAVQHRTDARFGSAIRLIGYDLESESSALNLTLHWEVVAVPANRYKIFAHLVSAEDEADIRAQADNDPRLPTTGWLPGEFLSDRLHVPLPDALPPGSYRLLVGLYDPITGGRLTVRDGDDQLVGDSLLLTTVHRGP